MHPKFQAKFGALVHMESYYNFQSLMFLNFERYSINARQLLDQFRKFTIIG